MKPDFIQRATVYNPNLQKGKITCTDLQLLCSWIPSAAHNTLHHSYYLVPTLLYELRIFLDVSFSRLSLPGHFFLHTSQPIVMDLYTIVFQIEALLPIILSVSKPP